MYSGLLFFHSITRWLVLVSLLISIGIALRGYLRKRAFSGPVNALRHWTATISHIQLVLGMILYIKSPVIRYFFLNYQEAKSNAEISFFALIHSLLMLLAVVVITIGSAKAKRVKTDKAKFATMLIWFSVALLLILIAIPWPFSPLASRPYIRPV